MQASSYRPTVDGLRAVAILGVVAYHAGVPGITGGFVGVDVFFVISGFLITGLLRQEIVTSGGLSITKFYARRARRILPALTVVLVTTVLLGFFLLPPGKARHELGASAVASALFLANQYFLTSTGGYFDGPSVLKPLLHLWSLAVEEQFYLVWPALLLAIARFAPPEARVAWMRRAILALSLASFLLSTYWVKTRPDAAFYVSLGRAWELGAGAFLALLESQRYRAAARPAIVAGAAMIVASFLLLESGTRFPGPAAVPAVLGTALIIWGDAISPNLISRILSSRPAVAIGLVSYGWYLWHWPLLAFARNARLMAVDRTADTAWVLLALVLAALMLRFIENPIRFGRRSRTVRTGAVLTAAAGSIAATIALASTQLTHEGPATASARARLAARAAADEPAAANLRCLVERRPGAGPSPACRFGAAGAPVEFVVWGDSHGASWTSLVNALQREGRPAYLQFTMMGCRPLSAQARDRNDAPCVEFRREVLAEIARLREQGLKGVIIAGRWPPLIGVERSVFDERAEPAGVRELVRTLRAGPAAPPAPAPHTDVLQADLRLTFAALRAAGVRTLVLLDPPEMNYPVANCLYFRFERPATCGISRKDYERDYAPIAATFRHVAAGDPGVRVFDPVDYFCDARGCPVLDRTGAPTMVDADHVSHSAAAALAPQLAADVAWLLGR
jgi:peptidoglycan/LPS O-acetylase OafA/YrhL